MAISNRIKLGLLVAPLLSIIFSFWLYETPLSWYVSPFYWAGFVSAGLVGMFFLAQDYLFPVKGVTRKKRKLGYLPVGIAGLVLVITSRIYPEALIGVFGIALGMYTGLSLRFFYLLIFRSRWSYCPTCGKPSWLLEVNGKWYCNKKGHIFHGLQAMSQTTGKLNDVTTNNQSLLP